jgi:hypothetical protein
MNVVAPLIAKVDCSAFQRSAKTSETAIAEDFRLEMSVNAPPTLKGLVGPYLIDSSLTADEGVSAGIPIDNQDIPLTLYEV